MRSVFNLCLVAFVLGFAFFFGRIAIIGLFADKAKTEISNLKIVNRLTVHDMPVDSSLEAAVPSRIPKSCFFNNTRSCVCYDQHTVVIKDFPVDRCQDIVNGLARF